MLKRLTASLLGLLALATLTAACGDDDDSNATASGDRADVTAPEDVKAPADEVAAGLAEIDQLGTDIAASVKAGDGDKVATLVDGIEPVWQKIEGTIKANDEDTYLAFEDAFAAIERAADDKDADAAATGASTISTLVEDYLKVYPA